MRSTPLDRLAVTGALCVFLAIPSHRSVEAGAGSALTESADPEASLSSDTLRLDFERFPDGSPACDRCPVTAEFAVEGVRFSFRSPFVPGGEATLVASGAYDPPGEEGNHSVTASLSDRGFFPGVLVLRFPDRPEWVSFRLRGPASVRDFEIRVYPPDGTGPLPRSAVERVETRTYGASRGGLFREEILRLESEAGIARIELDGTGPPGHILLVDDLRLER